MESLVILCMVVVILLFLMAGGAINTYKRKNYIKSLFKNSYGAKPGRVYKDGEYEHICGYFKNHQSDISIDDITWNDLNMDEMYARSNYCNSSAGEEYLYYLLRNPSDSSVRDELEPLIDYFANNEDERINLQFALYECGRTGKYSIYDYINNLDVLNGTNANIDKILVIADIIIFIIMFFNLSVGIALLVPSLLVGAFTYFKKKRMIEPYITCFSYVFRMINGAAGICNSQVDCIDDYKDNLHSLVSELTSFRRFSRIVMNQNSGSGDLLEIILDYIRMFLHLDIIKFYSMLDEIGKHKQDIDAMLTIIGKIDCSISIACYRESLNEWCRPDFNADSDLIAVSVYHPLLVEPVSNDVRLTRGILLTGSNASGKSTFLKTIAINAILAQSVNTVCASSYAAPRYRVMTSLALNDNIFEGESYYMTEIRSLKRIIDCGNRSDWPILACVDEVLRGTNTVERIAASSVILKNLSKVKGLILTATHDLELSYMLEEYYDNYHFEETVRDKDVSFSYKILTGRATTRNAIKLLEIMGYDEDIVCDAYKVVEKYEQTGAFT